jgi:hypothetical protein
MIRIVILLALGLSVLPGCGRRDRPTVRQTSLRPEEQSSATTASDPPPVADAVCPGRPAPHRPRTVRAAGTRSKRADATDSRRTNATDSNRADVNPPKTADTNPPKTADANPAKTADTKLPKIGATNPAKTAAGRPKAAGRGAADMSSSEVRIGGMCLVAPKTWTRERPPISFILAQFRLPRAKGDPSDAQLTVAAAGENDRRSLDRFQKHFDEKSEEDSVERLRIGDREVVLVENSGDYGDASDALPAPASEGRYRVLNAMVPVGNQLYFVNCTGPEKTVGQCAGEFRAFLQTMKPVDQQ